jgi:hypothetical protein
MLLILTPHARARIFHAIRLLERYHFLVIMIVLGLVVVTGGGMLVLGQQENTQVLGAKQKLTPTPKPTKTPTPTPTQKPTPTPKIKITSTPTLFATPTAMTATPTTAVSDDFPAKVLDLTNWKITLPIGTAESPTEIVQSPLATYKLDPWFVVAGGGVRFRAPVNAPTTSGSNYPRSELREMSNNGKDKASWGSNDGKTHTMTIEEAVTHLPFKKNQVVAGQIHDDSDDIMVIRLEGSNLYVNVDGKNIYTLTSSYTLGTRFSIKFEASGGKTNVYYNGNLVYTLDKNYDNAYFKAGVYTQSNCSKEDVCSSDNYGEVTIYSLSVLHQ